MDKLKQVGYSNFEIIIKTILLFLQQSGEDDLIHLLKGTNGDKINILVRYSLEFSRVIVC